MLTDDEDRQLRRGQWIAVAAAVAVACVGVGCALALYFPLHAVEMDRFRGEWKSACEQNVRLLDVAFNRQLAGMVLNAAAYASSVPIISQENLVTYANHSSMDQKVTYSVSNSPILSYDQLDEFESFYGRTVWPKPLPLEDDVLVNGQPIAAPMLYLFPTSLTPTVGGFNQFSDPRRRSALVALLQSPSQRITISDGPIAIIPTNARGFQVWVKVMNRTASKNTPFTSWLSGATVEIRTLLGATLANRTSDRGVFVEVIHPAGDLIYSTVPDNNTTSTALYSSQLLTIPVLNQQWTCKCWSATRLRGRFVTPWPAVVAVITAIVFLAAAEVARRGVLRHYSAKRLLQQYQTQNRLLSMLSRYSKAIIEALPDCLLVVNARGRILGINKAVLDVTGYTAAELESTPVTEIIFPMILDLGFREPPLSNDEDDPNPAAPLCARATFPRSVRSRATQPALPRIGNAADPLLENGVFEGTVRRSDGSTLLASIAINGTGAEDEERRAMLDHAIAAGVTPLVSHQRQLLDDEIAQVVLFHDISDQIQTQRMAGAARFDEREETQTKNSLLRFLAQAMLPLTLGMHNALARIQVWMRGSASGLVEFAPVVSMHDRHVSAVSANDVPPGIHARMSSRTAAEDIDAAVATAQHMVVLMEDLALLIGTPLYAGRQEKELVEGVLLYELQADALRAQDERIAAKRLRVMAAVHPPLVVVGGHLSTLRILMAKMLYLGSSIALPDAAWDITYAVTKANRGAASSSSPTNSIASTRSSRSSVSITAPTRRERPCRRRDASTMPPHSESTAPVMPLSVHLRQTLSAMDPSVILDDLELSLQHGSRGSEFGSLALTFVGLATFVKRIGGVAERSADPITGAYTLDFERAQCQRRDDRAGNDTTAPWNIYDEDRQFCRRQRLALAVAAALACALALYFPLHAVEMGRFRDEWKSACEQNVRLLDVAFNQPFAGMAMNHAINKNTPFETWLLAATVEIGMMLHATITNRTTERDVFIEVVHPTGEMIDSTLLMNDTTSAALHSSRTCKCWAASQLRDRFETQWPSVVDPVTALVFLLTAEVARRGVLRHYTSRRLLLQYQTQNRLLSTLSRFSKAIIGALHDCLLVVNAHGRILGINKAVLDATATVEFPAPLASESSTRSTTKPLLVAGVFEGTVRRSDGSTLPASTGVKTTTDIEDRRAMLDQAFSADVTPLISHQPRLLDDEIAQIVLFHDISDQIQAQRMAGAARFDEREATIVGPALPPVIHARMSSRTAAEDIDAAAAMAQHMVVLVEDLALLIGKPEERVVAKQMRVTAAVDPPTAIMGGTGLATLRVLMPKMLFLDCPARHRVGCQVHDHAHRSCSTVTFPFTGPNPPPPDPNHATLASVPLSIHLRQSLTAVNLSGAIDDLELSLQYG
ncbi:hypothetical protein GGF31_008744 [Allomyces arbusculus]|nr:hypothetical protein GGF31_008744 [Allomyces arbusculus]